MSDTKIQKSPALLGAIVALGASVGAVTTAYSEPVKLSPAEMDGVTAGGVICTKDFCPTPGSSGPTVTITRDGDGGALQIKIWDDAHYFKLESALMIKLGEQYDKLGGDVMSLLDGARYIKIGAY